MISSAILVWLRFGCVEEEAEKAQQHKHSCRGTKNLTPQDTPEIAPKQVQDSALFS